MLDKDFRRAIFETFYTSREESNCPLIPRIIESGKGLEDTNSEADIIISLRYGGRMLTNTVGKNFKELTRENFLEIIDYDPVKKILLVLGSSTPMKETPIHWIIQHARDDVHVVIQIKTDKEISGISVIEKNIDVLEMSKNILRKLRETDVVQIRDKGFVFVGKSLDETLLKIKKTLE